MNPYKGNKRFISFGDMSEEQLAYGTRMYWRAYYRLGPYLIGIILADLYLHTKDYAHKIPKVSFSNVHYKYLHIPCIHCTLKKKV